MNNTRIANPELNEPYQVGRDESRPLFEFGIEFSCKRIAPLTKSLNIFTNAEGCENFLQKHTLDSTI
jgi:hypothetical protein